MSILLRLVVAWLALAWSGSAAWDSEVLLEFDEDTVLAELRLPLRDLEAAFGRRLDPAGQLRSDVARYLGTHIDPVADDGRHWRVALEDVRIAQDARAHILVARAALVPPRGANPRRFSLGYDAIVRELPGHATRLAVRADRPATIALLDAPGVHVAIDGAAIAPWRRWLAASALGLRRATDAGRYLLLLSKTCAQVCSVLFLPRAVLLTVLVPGRRNFPASRRPIAGSSARRRRRTRHG